MYIYIFPFNVYCIYIYNHLDVIHLGLSMVDIHPLKWGAKLMGSQNFLGDMFFDTESTLGYEGLSKSAVIHNSWLFQW